jgi:hypothetical protein
MQTTKMPCRKCIVFKNQRTNFCCLDDCHAHKWAMGMIERRGEYPPTYLQQRINPSYIAEGEMNADT